MKSFILTLFLHCSMSLCLPAQTYMYLDEAFKSTTKPMPVKRKGIGTVGKYEFGTYRIISGKAGWTTTRGSANFFSGESQFESSSKSTFTITDQQTDTITVNITFTAMTRIEDNHSFLFRTLTGWVSPEVKENYEVYLASYSSSSDTTPWKMMLSYPVGDEIQGSIKSNDLASFHGIFSNEQTTFEIVPEFRWENGKQATLFKPVEGYSFRLHNQTVAAVQVLPFQKMFVWIKQDLPDQLRFSLAAGLATMMVRSEAAHQ